MNNYFIVSLLILTTLLSCSDSNQESSLAPQSGQNEANLAQTGKISQPKSILTQEDQASLTPDKIQSMLAEGNSRFMKGKVTHRDHTERIRKAVKGQYPKAVVLGCIDSRVPVEDVFDCGIGDIFVARVAGNFVNVDILGSLEYAGKVAGSKFLGVMGHEHCGAVKGTVANVQIGNITEMLQKIKPALDSAHKVYSGDQSVKNPEFVHLVAELNVRLNIERIRKESSVLRQMEKAGEIKMVGGLYDMDTGKVDFIIE